METPQLTRYGVLVQSNENTKKDLTVRPIVNNEFGAQPPSFKVFRASKKAKAAKMIYVPRYYHQGPVEDVRSEPVRYEIPFAGKLKKETHQVEALEKALGVGHGLLSLPCGYGKTTVALAIASKLSYKTLVIVHKEFLANQWRERINMFCPGVSIGLVQRDKVDTDHPFVIAMLQSLSMKDDYDPKLFDEFGTVIVDECHHICAQVFSRALFKMCPRHIFGLSATPIRKDGLSIVMEWFMGKPFFVVERENRGKVSVTTVEYSCDRYKEDPPLNRCGKVSMSTMITEIVEDNIRNQVILNTISSISHSRKILVLSERREHCKYIAEHFGEEAGLYIGGMTQKALDESAEKRIIVGTYSQAHEGLDIPSLDTLVMASPKSDIVQSVGRIMRETNGKTNHPHIYDIRDRWSVITGMIYKRNKVYKEKGFEIDQEEQEEPSSTVLSGFHFL